MEEIINNVVEKIEKGTPLEDAIKEVPRYDAQAKNFLKEKEVIAVILKDCVVEFKHESWEDIAYKLIEGTPLVSKVTIDADANVSAAFQQSAGSKIQGASNEDIKANEGKITYDVRFNVLAPKSGQLIKLIINIESQHDYYPGYPLFNRALYYASRLVSSQKNVEFMNDDYKNLKKICSIWIIQAPPENLKNKIICFDINPRLAFGDDPDLLKNMSEVCNMMSIVFIGIGDADTENLNATLKMLSTVFSYNLDADTKQQNLTDLGMNLTYEIKRTVGNMSGLGIGILKKGIEEGIEEGIEKGIEKGIEIGKANAMYDLVNAGIISPATGAAQINKLLTEFETCRAEYNRKKSLASDPLS